MKNPILSSRGRLGRLRYALPLLFVFSAGLMHADAAFTSGSASSTYSAGNAGGSSPSSSDNIQIQGTNASLTLRTDQRALFAPPKSQVSADGKTLAFDPNRSILIQGSSAFAELQFTYNGISYSSLWVVVSANFVGPVVTVSTDPAFSSPPGSYSGNVASVPFSMSGTVTVYASQGGAQILSVPISGSGFYKSYNVLTTGNAGGSNVGATYQFQPGFTLDATTQGSWSSRYGMDGYWIANGANQLPSYAQVTTAATTYTWAGSTPDVRALQNGPGSPNRIASTFTPANYSNTFQMSVNLTDGVNHPVALYFLDWDSANRIENITVTDAFNNVIDQETLSSFQNGVYGIWNLQGPVTITAKGTNSSPVLGGIFFGGSPAAPGFMLSSTAATVMDGSTGTSTVTVTPANGFASAATLAASNWPAGITGAFGTNPTSSSSLVTISVGSGVAPGPYSLTVTGTSGSLTVTTTIALTVTAIPPPPSFTLSGTSATAPSGSTGTSTVTVTPVNGFNSAVTLAASNWPSGFTGTFGTNPASASSLLTINVGSAVIPGPYSLTVTGTSGALTTSTTIAVTVIPPLGPPSFTLSATSATASTISAGISTITINPVNGFNSPVTLSLLGWPSSIHGFIGTNPVTSSSTITIILDSSVVSGSYSLTVGGAGGSLFTTTTIALTVVAPSGPFFTISGNPVSAVAGVSSGATNITINAMNGFNAPVALATSGWPAGITGSFAPNPATGTSTLMVNVGPDVAHGTVSLLIIGTSGPLTATTSITLTVTVLGFTLSATPVTIDPGSSGTSTITITHLDGSTFPVSFSFATFPIGGGSFAPQAATSSTVVTIDVPSGFAAGTYSIGVLGVNANYETTVLIPVTVTAKPSFTLSSTNVNLAPGTSVTATIAVNSFNGFNAPVTLWPSVLGAAKVTFAPNPATSSSVMTITAPASAGAFQSAVFVTGTSGSLTTMTSFSINATTQPTFNLSATNVSAVPGGSGISTVTLSRFNGYSNPMNLSTVGWPFGITGIFAPALASATSTSSILTVNVAPSVAAGTYTLMISGNVGSEQYQALLVLTVAPASSLGSSATYTGLDTTTEGAWNGKYGGDGFLIANGASSIPTYANVNVAGASTYTWAPQTSDPRALQSGTGLTTGIASSYYGNSFNINVNLSDGNTHQVALYLLDFDSTSRAGNIVVYDAATNAVLDQESFAGFHNGQWAVWNIKGSVIISVTSASSGVNSVFSGIFFGSGGSSSPGFTLLATAASIAAGSSGTTTITETPAPAGGVIDVTLSTTGWPAGITPGTQSNFNLGINVAANVTPGSYLLPVSGTKSTGAALTTIPLTVTAPSVFGGPSATYTGLDTTTQGAWNGKYGSDGYMIANGPTASSMLASATAIGASTYTWAAQSSDPRALVLPGTFNGIASAYTQYPATGFSFNVQTTGTVPVELYLLDWDSTSRSETITILDASTNAVLDTRTFSGFHNGQYAAWNIKGNVIIKVTPVGSSSPAVSGIFFN